MTAWWPLDGNFVDIVGNNLAIPFGNYTFDAGKVGKGLNLDGSSSYFVSETVPDPTDSFTFDCWVYWRGPTGNPQYIVARENGDSSESYKLQANDDGSVTVVMAQTKPHPHSKTSVPHALRLNGWTHVAVTLDGETGIAAVYLNGGRYFQLAGGREFGPYPISFGGFHGSQFFNGIIDEIEIYDRALNLDEIGDIAKAGAAGKCRPCAPPPPDMTAWWPLNGDLTDIQGGFNASSSGGANFGVGEVAQGIDLDGTSGTVTATGVPDPVSSFSFDSWVFWRGGAGTIVSRTGSYLLTTDASGALSLSLNGGTTTASSSSGALPSNEWAHVAVTYNGSQALVWVNGSFVFVANGSRVASATPLSFGSKQGTGFFNGLLDEIELFSRALTSNEVVYIYGAADAGKCRPSPVCYNGHSYFLTRQAGTWDQAEAEAVNAGGHLVAINDLFEHDFTVNYFQSGPYAQFTRRPLWIGLTSNAGPNMDWNLHRQYSAAAGTSAPTGDFHWTSGDPFTVSFWDSGEPGFDGPDVAQNWHFAAGESQTPGLWADIPADGIGDGNAAPPYFGIIEVPGCVGVPNSPVQPHPPQIYLPGKATKSTLEGRDVLITVNITNGEPIAHDTTVVYTLGGTAHLGSDYTVDPGDLSNPTPVGQIAFKQGDTQQFVLLHITADMIREGKETITFVLGDGPNYTVNAGHKKLTITIVKNRT